MNAQSPIRLMVLALIMSLFVLAEPGMGDDKSDSKKPVAKKTDSKADTAKKAADKKAAAKKKKKTQDVTFDDIKFEMKKTDPFKRSMLTKKIEKLSGNKVRIRGYILPSFKRKNITQFVLVRDNLECCFGPGAAIYDCILVSMKPKEGVTFTTRPITLEGTFKVSEFKGPDGKHLAIYRIDGLKVK